jgi:hypothetical protein
VHVRRSVNVVMKPADKQKAFENRIAARRPADANHLGNRNVKAKRIPQSGPPMGRSA